MSAQRASRYVARHLEADETLLASVVGVESRDGSSRRRQAVAATDRRVLVVWLRPAPPVSIGYDDLVSLDVEVTSEGGRVTVTSTTEVHVVHRIFDVRALYLLADLVEGRATRQVREPPPEKLRIVP